jgi:ABC-type ATPase with predicted acetyltransferase domain
MSKTFFDKQGFGWFYETEDEKPCKYINLDQEELKTLFELTPEEEN